MVSGSKENAIDNEFQKVKIKDLNDENNVDMFTTAVRGGKAFAAEQKIRELKTRISKAKNMVYPQKKLNNELCLVNVLRQYLTLIDLKRHRLHRRLDDYDAKKFTVKKKKFRDEHFIGEKVIVLAERIKKKSAPGKLYKQSVQNISYFNKEKTFIIRAI